MPHITIIGAGLAGCEAAYQASRRGVSVTLYEMKPKKMTPAHHKEGFAELVCSNSLRSNQIFNAVGLLKEEMRRMDSLIMRAAAETEVPAGSALAVDRDKFSEYITNAIRNDPNITVVEEEITTLPEDGVTIVATGPLTSDALSDHIAATLATERLHFFDAAAPIVDASTVNMDKAYLASRYGKGEASYLNCPMTKEEYEAFWEALISAKEAPLKAFDAEEQKLTVFEGCMPVEVMAKRGEQTLLFGPLKPVGLPDPKTGRDPYAVVQLRMENTEGSMYNLVGFQTHLTFEEQRRVFRMIPGLESAEFFRYGVMHRNTFIDSPRLLSSDYSMRARPNLFFAGQMTGVEGYVESAASGLLAGINASRRARGMESLILEAKSAVGALAKYVSNEAVVDFQPMNVNFGIIEPLGYRVKGGKAAKNDELARRAIEYVESMKEAIEM